ncbi:ATP-grasp domain-containing protein [Burkholderia glumae]|uniref:ATP-grasp domain-containing protein n=1 Tax=Burkholderia glumae TaxID=337 RepID=UPI002150D0D9|nr:ATP-grasp domain-containing protein [Burkholderia glumae]UVS99867.1 ATP-grasp domain-containing protein [Burkholderia glumae]
MRLGILQLPYNIDNLKQIVSNLQCFDGTVVLLDDSRKLKLAESFSLPANCELVACDVSDVEQLVSLAVRLALDNLVSFSELGLRTAAAVRERTGFAGHGEQVELNTVDKYRMRTTLAEHGLSSVATRRCGAAQLRDALASMALPAIVKPADLTGSICVQLIEHIDEVDGYLERVARNAYTKHSDFVVESYVTGDEYSVEGLLLEGEVHLYGITEKFTTGVPYFVETGHAFHAKHPLLEAVDAQLPPIFRALGMRTCPFHIEFKMVDGRIEIIEIHSRFGGGFITKLIELSLDSPIFLDYANYLKTGKIPEKRAASARITAIHFVMCRSGRVETRDLVDPTDHDWILEHQCGKAVGDTVEAATGYYDRPAYYLYDAPSRDVEAARRALLAGSRFIVQ